MMIATARAARFSARVDVHGALKARTPERCGQQLESQEEIGGGGYRGVTSFRQPADKSSKFRPCRTWIVCICATLRTARRANGGECL